MTILAQHIRPGYLRVRGGYQTGFTLVEVMVAIVILSFGLLGVAGMMVKGIQFTHSAQQRSVATLLAYDMIDRMRSNQAGVALADNLAGGGNYHRPASNVTAVGSPYIIQKGACVGAVAAPVGTCAAGDMADQDSYEWEQAILARLGSGVGIVCRDSSNSPGSYNGSVITHGCDGIGPKYSIKIFWLDDRTDSNVAGTFQSCQTSFIP
jgi:type IV pilus assembly protein PilV